MSIIFNATFESDTGTLASWFNSTVTQDTAEAHSGTGSLKVVATADGGAVVSNNYPYNSGVVAGSSYDFSVWHKLGAGSVTTGPITVTVYWYDNAVVVISQSDFTAFTPTSTWTQATMNGVTAPTGTVTFAWAMTGSLNASVYHLDDLIAQDAVSGGTGPPGRPPIVMPSPAATQASTW